MKKLFLLLIALFSINFVCNAQFLETRAIDKSEQIPQVKFSVPIIQPEQRTDVKKHFWPQYLVMEDLATGDQTQYYKDQIRKVTLLPASGHDVKIEVTRIIGGMPTTELRWMSPKEVIIQYDNGDVESYTALVMANHDQSLNPHSFRYLAEVDGGLILDFDD